MEKPGRDLSRLSLWGMMRKLGVGWSTCWIPEPVGTRRANRLPWRTGVWWYSQYVAQARKAASPITWFPRRSSSVACGALCATEAGGAWSGWVDSVSYTHLRAHETDSYLVCRLLL